MKHLLVFSGLLMGASLLAPIPVKADRDDRRDERRVERRYYDRTGRDYHRWNDDEDREYRGYLVERHREYVPFQRVRPRDRQEYFKYRHEHGFKVEIR